MILLGTACVIYVSFCYILPLVVPFVLALVFAKALQPWTKKIHTATHLNRKLCSVLMVVVSLGALGCFLFYIGYLCTSQLVEFIRHLPGQAGALSHLCQGGCGSIDNLLALSKGTSYRWLEARMSDMDGQIASVLLPQITGSIPRMFLRIGEWGAGFVVFLMAVLLLSLEERTGTCALRKETKNRGICLSQSAGAAFIFYRSHFDDRIASAQKSVCGADGNPDRDRRCISGSWKRHNFNSMGGLFVDPEGLCGRRRAFDAVCGHNGRPRSAGAQTYGKRNGVKAALRAFVRVCGAEIVWCRRNRAWSDRAYDIKNGI